jgi:hypothetical protein
MSSVQACGLGFATLPTSNPPFDVSEVEERTGAQIQSLPYLSDPVKAAWRETRRARVALSELVIRLMVYQDNCTRLINFFMEPYGGFVHWMNDSAPTGSFTLRSSHGIIMHSLDSCATGASYYLNKHDEVQGRNFLFEGGWNLMFTSIGILTAQNMVIDMGEELLDGYESLFSTLQILLPVFIGVGFILLQGVSLTWFYRDIDYALTILRHVSPAAVESSLLPISRGAKDEKINLNVTKLEKNHGNLGYTILPFVIIFVILIDAVAFAFGFVLCNSSLSDSKSLLRWYSYAAERIGE